MGIAFAADSSLYVETLQGELIRVNPNDGTITNLGTMTGIVGSPRDLASCSFNGSLQAQKNIVGRVTPTDQFTMTITGGGVTSGNTGTTSGSSTGLQTSPARSPVPSSAFPVRRTTWWRPRPAAACRTTGRRGHVSMGRARSRVAPGRASTSLFPPPRGAPGPLWPALSHNAPASIAVTKTPSPTSVTAAGPDDHLLLCRDQYRAAAPDRRDGRRHPDASGRRTH